MLFCVLVVASLSGPGGASLRIFDFETGDLIAEKFLHNPNTARLFEPNDVGTSMTFLSQEGQFSDMLVLTSGHVLRRVDSSGEVQWTWTSPDETWVLLLPGSI